MSTRTPDEIRDDSIRRFNELAVDKFDQGQKEHGSCLDDTVDFHKMEEEILDLWFYLQSMKRKTQNDLREARIS